MLRNLFRRGQAANDFNITVSDSDWNHEWIDLISTQTTNVNLNLVDKEVTLIVRQLRTGWIQDLIMHILQRDTSMIEQIRLSPAKRQSYEYVFTNGKLVDHDVAYDLYRRDTIDHLLVFQFESVTLHSNETHSLSSKVKLGVDKKGDRVNLME